MKLLLTIIAFFGASISFGQKAFVEKKIKDAGTSIGIVIVDKNKTHRYAPNCAFKDVCLLADSAKIVLIGELLSYAADTSLYYAPVSKATNHYMGKKWPISTRYNTQLSILFYINYIAFSSKAFSYSPFPVLFDRQNHSEVTSCSDALDIVISDYKNWHKKIKVYGFANYGFPLWGGRYQWFGSIMADIKFKEYPKWEDYYSCQTIE